jgi:hypothetical protein
MDTLYTVPYPVATVPNVELVEVMGGKWKVTSVTRYQYNGTGAMATATIEVVFPQLGGALSEMDRILTTRRQA